jgi:hypothetical protein
LESASFPSESQIIEENEIIQFPYIRIGIIALQPILALSWMFSGAFIVEIQINGCWSPCQFDGLTLGFVFSLRRGKAFFRYTLSAGTKKNSER